MPSLNRQRSMKDAMVARKDIEDAKSQPPKKYERRYGSQGRYGGCQVSTCQVSVKDAMVAKEGSEDAKSQPPNKYERRQVAREDMEDAKSQPTKKYERRHGRQGRYGGCQVSTAKEV